MRSTLAGLFVAFALVAPSVRAEERPWLFIARVGPFASRVSEAGGLLSERSQTFGLDQGDWLGATGGVEVALKAARLLEVGQHVDAFVRGVDGPQGSLPDGHSLLSDAVVWGFTARLIQTRSEARFAPYVAAGPDLVVWRYKETAPDGERKADGVSAGFHLAAGVRVFVGRNLALSGEYRRQLGGADLKGEFAGQHLDLTGDSGTLGLFYRF